MKSYKDRVLLVYGRAETWENISRPIMSKKYRWRVHCCRTTPNERYMILGFGYTEADAWKDSWKRMEREMLWKFENDRL